MPFPAPLAAASWSTAPGARWLLGLAAAVPLSCSVSAAGDFVAGLMPQETRGAGRRDVCILRMASR